MTQTLQLFTFQQLLQNTGMFFSTSPSTFGQQNHILYLKYRFLNTLNSGPRVPVSPVSDTFGFQRESSDFSAQAGSVSKTLHWLDFCCQMCPMATQTLGRGLRWTRCEMQGELFETKYEYTVHIYIHVYIYNIYIYIHKPYTTRYSIHERIQKYYTLFLILLMISGLHFGSGLFLGHSS